jgi:hypothetical protein
LLSLEGLAAISLSFANIAVLKPVVIVAMLLSIDAIATLLSMSPIVLPSSDYSIDLLPSDFSIASCLLPGEEILGIGIRRLGSVAIVVGVIGHANRGDLYLRFGVCGLWCLLRSVG